MNLLKIRHPLVWTRLTEAQKRLNKRLIKTTRTKPGMPNLYINSKPRLYIHHKYDPVGEAEQLIEQQKDIEESSDILFYGTGLGYHIQAFVIKYPKIMFSIYEPVPEVFFQFLSNIDLIELPMSSIKYIFVEGSPEDAGRFANEYVGQMRDSVCIIDFPVYQEAFPDKYKEFFSKFEDAINERRSAVNTTNSFEKLWTLNSMLNLEKVLSTPGILLGRKNHFKNKPALLVGAGPSLEDEIENLRHIKENGLAYIFSAGASINTLIDYGIHPHAACTYDPSDRNHIVFQKLVDKGITDIPLFFGSSVGYKTLEKYPGKLFHLLTSPDKVAPFYLRSKSGDELTIIHDAPSVASIVLQLLIKLGFNPIILVGLNLAYRDNKQHAVGLDYSNAFLSGIQTAAALEVEDVYGGITLTNPTYNRMRQQVEIYAKIHPDFKIINTSRYGAKIAATTFQPLDELIEEILKETIYDKHWLDIEGGNYDMGYCISQYIAMNQARVNIDKLIKTIHSFIYKLNRQAENNKFRNMQNMYAALDVALNELKNNPFFHHFIRPMNQIAEEVLQRAMHNVNMEKDNYLQANRTVLEYEEFLFSCENDLQMITHVFSKMNTSIEKFIFAQIKEKARKIKVLITDWDGILSNGEFYLINSKTARIKLNDRDRKGITRFQQEGLKTVLATIENNKAVEAACRYLGFQDIHMNTKDKNLLLETICTEWAVSPDEIACVIGDVNDLELAGKAGLSFAANDARGEVKEKVDYVCTRKAGEGAIYEVVQVLISDDFPLHGTVIRT